MRLEGHDLQVARLRYFNRGVEVRGAGTIHDIWKMPDSSLDGWAVGSARPLKDVKLPFFADADQIFAALQTNATTFRVDGTVRKPKAAPAALREVGEAMRALIIGDVQQR
jgi:hypothetical protein